MSFVAERVKIAKEFARHWDEDITALHGDGKFPESSVQWSVMNDGYEPRGLHQYVKLMIMNGASTLLEIGGGRPVYSRSYGMIVFSIFMRKGHQGDVYSRLLADTISKRLRQREWALYEDETDDNMWAPDGDSVSVGLIRTREPYLQEMGMVMVEEEPYYQLDLVIPYHRDN